jgi:hypothetical protein
MADDLAAASFPGERAPVKVGDERKSAMHSQELFGWDGVRPAAPREVTSANTTLLASDSGCPRYGVGRAGGMCPVARLLSVNAHNTPSSEVRERPAGTRGASLGQGLRAPGHRRGPRVGINLSRGGGRFQAGGEAAEHGRLRRQRGHSPRHSRGIVACRLASGTSPSMYAFRAQPARDPAFRRPAPPECGQRQTARRYGARSLPAYCRCPTVLTALPSCLRTLGSRHGSAAVTYENRRRRTPTSATGAAWCA